MSRIPPQLLLIPCTSSRCIPHRPLSVAEPSHYAHLIPILLISNCIYVPSVHHCSHVRSSVSTFALLFRLACCVYCTLVTMGLVPCSVLRDSSHVFIRGLTSLFCLGYIPLFLYTCLFWASSPFLSWHVILTPYYVFLRLAPIIYST